MHTDLAENIRRYLKAYNMSQKMLAEKANIAYSTVSDILSGKISPTLATIEQISEAINISTAELLGGSIDDQDLSDDKKVLIGYIKSASESDIEKMIMITKLLM